MCVYICLPSSLACLTTHTAVTAGYWCWDSCRNYWSVFLRFPHRVPFGSSEIAVVTAAFCRRLSPGRLCVPACSCCSRNSTRQRRRRREEGGKKLQRFLLGERKAARLVRLDRYGFTASPDLTPCRSRDQYSPSFSSSSSTNLPLFFFFVFFFFLSSLSPLSLFFPLSLSSPLSLSFHLLLPLLVFFSFFVSFAQPSALGITKRLSGRLN